MKKYLLNTILRISGKDIFSEYENIKKYEFNDIDENLKIQKKALEDLILHCYINVPYYKSIFDQVGLVKGQSIDLSKFTCLPILTKKIIREKFDQLKSVDEEIVTRKLYDDTSGGSTGEPVRLIKDQQVWTTSMAGKWLFYSFISGFPCKHVKLWGSERDILKAGHGLQGSLKNWLYDRRILNAYKMSGIDMFNYVKSINTYKPIIIEAYVQSIFELARFIKDNSLNVYQPEGIITTAATLHPDMKTSIEEVFRCKVYNRYGSREVGDIACSCDKDEGLHLNLFHSFVEILNEALEPCKPGEAGKVYITTLNNYSMPLLRYDIGDVAVEANSKQCSCRRGLPLIARVTGRVTDYFINENGDYIYGGIFTRLFYFKKWVKQFQVIQRDYDFIDIFIVGERDEQELRSIEEKVRIIMGDDCKIKWSFVDEIQPTKSGKYLYTISKVK